MTDWIDKYRKGEIKLGNHPLVALVRSYEPLLLFDYAEEAAYFRKIFETLSNSSVVAVVEPPVAGFTLPQIAGSGDSDYFTGPNNPTKCTVSARLSVDDANRLTLSVDGRIYESGGDHTNAQQQRSWQLFTPPKGWRIAGFQLIEGGELYQSREFAPAVQDATTEHQVLTFPDDAPVPLVKDAKIFATQRYRSAGVYGRVEVQLRPILVKLTPVRNSPVVVRKAD